MYTNPNNEIPSVLTRLRALIPNRPVSFTEALRLAELQARRLLELHAVDEAPVPSEIVSELPRIRVRYSFLPTSGLSYWDGQQWVICLNIREPIGRQRFTLLHEYKHVIDHGRTSNLYRGGARNTPERQAEHAADYFAGCVLMPKRLVKHAWSDGIQSIGELAAKFDVSEQAIEVGLVQLGLTEPTQRHLRTAPAFGPRNRRVRYYRQRPAHWPETTGALA
jgi:Zn-dependent peptidase ImmA (M78 family)